MQYQFNFDYLRPVHNCRSRFDKFTTNGITQIPFALSSELAELPKGRFFWISLIETKMPVRYNA